MYANDTKLLKTFAYCMCLFQGHPAELPAQLGVIPPTLARIVAEQTQAKVTLE